MPARGQAHTTVGRGLGARRKRGGARATCAQEQGKARATCTLRLGVDGALADERAAVTVREEEEEEEEVAFGRGAVAAGEWRARRPADCGPVPTAEGAGGWWLCRGGQCEDLGPWLL